MTKKEYLAALGKELQALPYDEQKEALEYYENYFDDAGLENEQSVIDELGNVEISQNYEKRNKNCSDYRFDFDGYRVYSYACIFYRWSTFSRFHE